MTIPEIITLYAGMKSQSDVARWLGMTRAAVNLWAQGKGVPKMSWLMGLLEDEDPAKRLFARRCIVAIYPIVQEIDFSKV